MKIFFQAIDVWMAGCMLFVFAAIGEFIVIKLINTIQTDAKIYPLQVQPVSIE